MTRGPVIIEDGDPNCVHYEYVSTDLIGTCRGCGRVRSYRGLSGEGEPALLKTPLSRLGMLFPPRLKGGHPIGKRTTTSSPTRRQIHVPQPVKVKVKRKKGALDVYPSS